LELEMKSESNADVLAVLERAVTPLIGKGVYRG
jgi:hypothetical protein